MNNSYTNLTQHENQQLKNDDVKYTVYFGFFFSFPRKYLPNSQIRKCVIGITRCARFHKKRKQIVIFCCFSLLNIHQKLRFFLRTDVLAKSIRDNRVMTRLTTLCHLNGVLLKRYSVVSAYNLRKPKLF